MKVMSFKDKFTVRNIASPNKLQRASYFNYFERDTTYTLHNNFAHQVKHIKS